MGGRLNVYTFESTSLLEFANGERLQPASIEEVAVPLPDVIDLTGYEVLVDLIRREGLDRMTGDFLEIGCFLGGGTAKLAKLAASTDKQVWVIDPFDPTLDLTRNLAGNRMADLYRDYLHGHSQEEIFRQVTAPWSASIQVLKQDSMKVRLPDGLRFSFAFTDGNHDPAWVKSDFQLVWRRLLPGGWAAFHDYGGDLPDVTAALDSMLGQYAAEIGRVEKIEDRWILLVQKRSEASGKDQSSS
jgi:SAM-dependent methyltransferase